MRYIARMAYTQASKQQLEALHRLNSAEFAPLRQFIQTERDVALARLTKADEPRQMYRAQGVVVALGDLLQAIETASDNLARQ